MSNLSDTELSVLIAEFEDGRTVDPEEALKALYELKALREACKQHEQRRIELAGKLANKSEI